MVSDNNKNLNLISKHILQLLFDFSYSVLSTQKTTNALLEDPCFNENEDFINFISYFNNGTYFLFRSQGYMECLVLTKCYNPQYIDYWKTGLLFPATKFYIKALGYIENLSEYYQLICNDNFHTLLRELEKLKMSLKEIVDTLKLYKFTC